MLSVGRSLVLAALTMLRLARPGAAPRSYGRRGPWVQMRARAFALAAVLVGAGLPLSPAPCAEGPVRIVALGDSLTAGFGLPADAVFPVRLQKALAAKDFKNERLAGLRLEAAFITGADLPIDGGLTAR